MRILRVLAILVSELRTAKNRSNPRFANPAKFAVIYGFRRPSDGSVESAIANYVQRPAYGTLAIL